MSLLKSLWEDTLKYMKEELSGPSYKTWIESIVPYKIEGDTIFLSVAEEYNKNVLEQRYCDLITNSILEASGQKYKLFIKVGIEKEEVKHSFTPRAPKYTFDNFVVGNSNKFAHGISLAVAESPGVGYNPLFLWGGVGIGKTHLMHAIENYVNEHNKNLKTLFISAEAFTTELIESLTKKTTEAFRDKYRKIDVLLVDDIHFIAGKPSTEEEFFNTFNALFESGKQIVLSSDRPPHEISGLTERLKSRFGWGILCDIQPPEYETRLAILKQKAEDQNVNIDTEILMYIADNITMNIRELEGVFKTLSAYSGLVNTEISLSMAEDAIKKYRTQIAERVILPENIIEAVVKVFRVSKEELTSTRRTNEIVVPRNIAIYLCKNLTELSYKKIGDVFGGKDHSTIIHSIKKVEDYKKDKDLNEKITIIENDLKHI